MKARGPARWTVDFDSDEDVEVVARVIDRRRATTRVPHRVKDAEAERRARLTPSWLSTGRGQRSKAVEPGAPTTGVYARARRPICLLSVEPTRFRIGGGICPSSAQHHLRPVVPRNHAGTDEAQVLFMHGRYDSYTDYDTTVALTNRSLA